MKTTTIGKAMVAATLLLGACSNGSSTTQQRAYIIDQTNADQFLALIARTAALAGRHSVLPASRSWDNSLALCGSCIALLPCALR